jgi:hypothetical protein
MSGPEIRIPVPGSGMEAAYACQDERDRSLVIARERQEMAREGTGARGWDELDGAGQEDAALEGRNWLRAAVRAGIALPCPWEAGVASAYGAGSPAGPRPPAFGPHQMADHLGVSRGQVARARELGLLPEPDTGGTRWSAAAVSEVRGRWAAIEAAVEAARELGAARCAGLLGARTGLEVEAADVEVLAERGLVQASGSYRGWPLYRVTGIEALAGDPGQVTVLAGVVAERQAWLAGSLEGSQAAERLGWPAQEFRRVVEERGILAGGFGRYAVADIEALAADEDLAEQVRGNRLLGPDQAAEHLEIRRTDFDYCVAGGWITPVGYTESHVSRRRAVSVPLYRAAGVEALLTIPGVDWEAVRAARPGEPSPLREHARLPASRAALVRGFAAGLAGRYGMPVTARYDGDRGQWELAWVPGASGHPDGAPSGLPCGPIASSPLTRPSSCCGRSPARRLQRRGHPRVR